MARSAAHGRPPSAHSRAADSTLCCVAACLCSPSAPHPRPSTRRSAQVSFSSLGMQEFMVNWARQVEKKARGPQASWMQLCSPRDETPQPILRHHAPRPIDRTSARSSSARSTRGRSKSAQSRTSPPSRSVRPPQLSPADPPASRVLPCPGEPAEPAALSPPAPPQATSR